MMVSPTHSARTCLAIIALLVICSASVFGQRSYGRITAAALAVDRSGNIFYVDALTLEIKVIDKVTGCVRKVAGNRKPESNGDGNLAYSAGVKPTAILVDRKGDMFVAEIGGKVRHIDKQSGVISTIARDLKSADGLAMDSNGTLFISDSLENRIWRLDAVAKTLTTYAGGGDAGLGDGGHATKSTLKFPDGIALDRDGNLFIADIGHRRIRRVEKQTGIITTVALGDESDSAEPHFRSPGSIALDKDGNIYTTGLDVLFRISAETYTISRYAGTGSPGFGGDGGPALKAIVDEPSAITLDPDGNVYFSDYGNQRIRRIDAGTGLINSVKACKCPK